MLFDHRPGQAVLLFAMLSALPLCAQEPDAAQPEDAAFDWPRQIDIEHVEGLYVVRVYPGTPADRASITEGTIIMQINKEPVSSVNDLRNMAQNLSRENRISLIVQEPDGSIARKVIRP